jgi:ankyrin repeat protein
MQELLASRPNDEAFAYFYFNRNDSSRRSPPAALCSLVRQLSVLTSDRGLPQALVQLYYGKKQRQRELAEDCLHEADAAHLLRQLAEVFPQTTLVLDALDECDSETRLSLVNLLDELVRSAGRPVKIFISSRLDEDIRQRYKRRPNLAIRAVDNQDDIARYVKATMAGRPDWSGKVSHSLRQEIVQTLMDRSEGMLVTHTCNVPSSFYSPSFTKPAGTQHLLRANRFQWAALQLGQLLQLWRESDIRARLGKLPIGLEQTYDELHAAIRAQPGSAPAVAERAFQWVMCAFRPLKAAELVAAVCQDPELDSVQPVDVDIEFVRRACRNLLVVNPKEGTCGFSHLSVQEYFETRVWSASQAHGLVAKTCLTLLIAKSVDLPHTLDSSASGDPAVLTEPSGVHYELPYAVEYWPKHINEHGDDNVDARLTRLLQSFLGSMDASSAAFKNWSNCYKMLWRNGIDGLFPTTSASFCICYYGFNQILADWWVKGFHDPHQRNNQGQSLLHLAVMSNSLVVTKRLLGYGLRVDLQAYDGAYALTTAAQCGNVSLAKLLLDAGADVNARGGMYGCPLGAAAYWGREGVVRLLLDAGADVNAMGGMYDCPLGAAAYGGWKGVVRLLLDAGADVNAMGGMYGCPLGVAAAKGEEGMVRLLMDASADVNAVGGEYGCPLGAAAYWGMEGVVRLLLDAGADVNAKGGKHGCPLGAAACGKELQAAQLLLDSGADMNLHGGFCSLRLLSAAAHHQGIIMLLQLETRCDAVENGGLLNTVLSCAAMSDYGFDLKLMQLLLKTWASLLPHSRGQRALAPAYSDEDDHLRDVSSDVRTKVKRKEKSRRNSV